MASGESVAGCCDEVRNRETTKCGVKMMLKTNKVKEEWILNYHKITQEI